MTLSGPNGYTADISSRIQPDGDRRYLGSDVYTATTDVISGGRDCDVYQCNVTSSTSLTGSTTLRGMYNIFISTPYVFQDFCKAGFIIIMCVTTCIISHHL